MSAWFCSTVEGTTVHPNQDAAEKAAARFKGPAVAWEFHGVVEEPPTPPETHEKAPVAAEGMVERVLGHLGLRTGAETA